MKKARLFTALTYAISFVWAGLYYALGGKLGGPAFVAMATAYMFIPAAVTVLIQKLIYKEQVIAPLGVVFKPNLWWLAACLFPTLWAAGALGVSLLIPGVRYDPSMAGLLEGLKSVLPPERLAQLKDQAALMPIHPFWLVLISAPIAGCTVNAVAGFGEELGWRGLLQKELESLGFWRSSAIIGVIWGFWHAPIILMGYNYPQHPVIGVFMMVALTMLLAPLFSYIRTMGKSVIAAAIVHGAFNASAGLAVLVIRGGSDLTVGSIGLAGFAVLAVSNLILYAVTGRNKLAQPGLGLKVKEQNAAD